MQKFLRSAKRFIKSEDGPTATEYAVVLASLSWHALRPFHCSANRSTLCSAAFRQSLRRLKKARGYPGLFLIS